MKKSPIYPNCKILKNLNLVKMKRLRSREYGVSKATFYKWRQRYGGVEASELKRIKQLEEENLYEVKTHVADLAFKVRYGSK